MAEPATDEQAAEWSHYESLTKEGTRMLVARIEAETARLHEFREQVQHERIVASNELAAEKARADENESFKARYREAQEACEPWVQGPGVVGAILHLQERIAALEEERDAYRSTLAAYSKRYDD